MSANNEILINEHGEIEREMTLHMARLENCENMDDVKKEMIFHMQNELSIREKYTNHRIKIISEMEIER